MIQRPGAATEEMDTTAAPDRTSKRADNRALEVDARFAGVFPLRRILSDDEESAVTWKRVTEDPCVTRIIEDALTTRGIGRATMC
jgi:hypothetical protein